MEYSFVGKNDQALEFLGRAQKLSPDNEKVNELIRITESMAYEEQEDVSVSIQSEKMEKMMAVFEEYQKKQNDLLLRYDEAQQKIREIVETSEREKEKLYGLLKEKEEEVASVIKQQDMERKKVLAFITRTLLVAAGAVALIISFFALRQYNQNRSQRLFQSRIAESFRELTDTAGADLSDHEKKMRKLGIIERELAGRDPRENQVALKMLDDFLKDGSYKIRLKAIRILHDIDPQKAVKSLEPLMKSQELRPEIESLIKDIYSPDIVELLLKLAGSENQELKRMAVSALIEIMKKQKIDPELEIKIKKTIEKNYRQEEWIVA
jgi:hypothetical protein